MANVVVITQVTELADLPAALTMLPHTLRLVAQLDTELGDVDVLVVDARADLGQGRDACLAASSRGEPPVLLLLGTGGLAVVQDAWGAADFVLDSAEPAELDARVRLLAGRRGSTSVIKAGPITIDEDGYTAAASGRPLDLTYTEFELLRHLATHPGRVLTRENLLSEVWGYDYYGGTRTVDVHIRRLRAKLGPEAEGHITTVRNVGYRFSVSR